MNDSVPIECGDIYAVQPFITYGRTLDMKSGRYGVVISDNKRNKDIGTVLMVFLTHAPARGKNMLSITTKELGVSTLIADQIFTVDKSLIQRYICKIPPEHYSRLATCLRHSIPPVNVNEEMASELTRIRSEAQYYKESYFKLLQKLKGESTK